jgi:hypothetical protein
MVIFWADGTNKMSWRESEAVDSRATQTL